MASEAASGTMPAEATDLFVRRWRSLLESDPNPVVVLARRDFSVVFANAAALALFGDDPAASIRETVPADAVSAVDLEGCWLGEGEVPGGSCCPVVAMAVSPPPLGAVCLIWRIEGTDSGGAGLAQRVLEHASDLIVGVDDSGRIVYRNLRALGYFPREILGLLARDVLPGPALSALEDGAETDPEVTVDADGARRMQCWRGLAQAIEDRRIQLSHELAGYRMPIPEQAPRGAELPGRGGEACP